MEPPVTSAEPISKKIEGVKEANSFYCDLFDSEIVHKIAEVLLPGLATACIDSTTGDLFRSPVSVAADTRKEMVEYLTERSETFVAESVILENAYEDASDHPYDIISDFVDDFVSTKKNLLSQVSGWLSSEKREDKIDDFVQEMDINRFWSIDAREAVVQNLIKNVDTQSSFHCSMKFNSSEDLAEHGRQCSFRSLNCKNEGCNARVSAGYMAMHDSACPFKLVPCEQMCLDEIMRREMDKHCITVCPMRLVTCPFYSVGCQCTLPLGKVREHVSENLHYHLLGVFQLIHKESSANDLEQRCEKLEKLSSPGHLAAAQDVRSLISAVKGVETEFAEALEEVNATSNPNEEQSESLNVLHESKS